jgi:hypothetical protein
VKAGRRGAGRTHKKRNQTNEQRNASPKCSAVPQRAKEALARPPPPSSSCPCQVPLLSSDAEFTAASSMQRLGGRVEAPAAETRWPGSADCKRSAREEATHVRRFYAAARHRQTRRGCECVEDEDSERVRCCSRACLPDRRQSQWSSGSHSCTPNGPAAFAPAVHSVCTSACVLPSRAFPFCCLPPCFCAAVLCCLLPLLGSAAWQREAEAAGTGRGGEKGRGMQKGQSTVRWKFLECATRQRTALRCLQPVRTPHRAAPRATDQLAATGRAQGKRVQVVPVHSSVCKFRVTAAASCGP